MSEQVYNTICLVVQHEPEQNHEKMFSSLARSCRIDLHHHVSPPTNDPKVNEDHKFKVGV